MSSYSATNRSSTSRGSLESNAVSRLLGRAQHLLGHVVNTFAYRNRAVNCCGIVGYVGRKDVQPILMDGVRILQNRGYDSCGMATISQKGDLTVTKFASRGSTSDCVELLERHSPKIHSGHNIGIAHTRWATHGAKTDINAHPHADYKNRICVVHNGTIENYSSLREDLVTRGIPFTTETDTEVIANLIGVGLDQGNSITSSFESTISQLRGTWGLALIHKEHPDQILLARNGSPLLVGCSESEVFVASEPTALANHTNHFLALHDGEICLLNPAGIQNLSATRSIQKIQVENVEKSPEPYEYWTLKEIYEQPQSLARALNYGGRLSPLGNHVKLGGLDSSSAQLLEIRHLVISACGTSLYAGLYGERLMQQMRCFDTVRCLDASETHADALPPEHGGMLLISQSGETLDTIRACQIAESAGVFRFSMVNVVGSLLARMTGCGVYLNAGREVAVASTKAFTSQVVVLALIATWFSRRRVNQSVRCGGLMDAIHRLPVYAGMTMECRDKCKEIANRLKNAKAIFVLGKGLSYPVALEGALKIKEIAYIHAEGFAAGALKHGPFALIDAEERTPVILIAPTDEDRLLLRNTAEQLKARGAFLIGVIDDPTHLAGLLDDQLLVPANGPLTPLLCCIPLQLLAYEISVARGINPDKPRCLAKTVTVS